LLATEYAQNAVRITLIANVASAYFQLRAFDQELDASTRILQANRETLRITTLSVNGGASPITDQLQATLLVQQAQAQITQLEQSIAQTENQLSLLLGKNPGDVVRGSSLEKQAQLPQLPMGLPSQLLERRPDVREAEEIISSRGRERPEGITCGRVEPRQRCGRSTVWQAVVCGRYERLGIARRLDAPNPNRKARARRRNPPS
jgi:outer membrane protein TolC